MAHTIEHADGDLETAEDGRPRLRFTRRFPHAREKVWRAITEPEHLASWFPNDIEGDRRAGAKLRHRFRNGEAPDFDGEMLVYDPPSVLELTWGGDVLRFELHDDDGGTRMVFTDTIDELGKAARDSAGWHACFDLLTFQLDGVEPTFDAGDRWKAVEQEYKDRHGPEASTIGPPDGTS